MVVVVAAGLFTACGSAERRDRVLLLSTPPKKKRCLLLQLYINTTITLQHYITHCYIAKESSQYNDYYTAYNLIHGRRHIYRYVVIFSHVFLECIYPRLLDGTVAIGILCGVFVISLIRILDDKHVLLRMIRTQLICSFATVPI